MSLKNIGNRSASLALRSTEEPERLGIPGSGRFVLFYQDGRHLPVASHGQGIYIWDVDGKRYLDGSSGAFAANIGHGRERIAARAKAQMDRIAFTYRTQFESEPANELAELLARLSPPQLGRVFFVNSGSEAVEAAIKLARQYWWATGHKGKTLVIARRPSYHGATLGALSCTDYAPFNIPYRSMLLPFPKISAPFCYHCPQGKRYPECGVACAHELERAIQVNGSENVAAFVAEPIGGASTGAAVPPDEYFAIVERICHENEVALIMDEVLTGCGRTGTFYGFDHWDVTPDIVCLSKGLSGGYSPIGAVVASDDIVTPVLESGGFMHGHTYAGNPLSAAVASEVIQVLLEEDLVTNAREVGTYLHQQLRELKLRYPFIGDVRGRGLLAAVEFVRDRGAHEPFPAGWFVAHEATEIARDKGLVVYPRRSWYGLTGDHVLIAPPLIIDRAGVDELLALFAATLDDLGKLLKHHIEPKRLRVPDGTVERFELPADVEEVAVGHIEKVAPEPEANATPLMQGGVMEILHGSELSGGEVTPLAELPGEFLQEDISTDEAPTAAARNDDAEG